MLAINIFPLIWTIHLSFTNYRANRPNATVADVGIDNYVSVLTDPSTAGVLASYASLGDVILAEPKALVGFAGARVIRQTIGQDLPEGFQRAEFVLEKGFIDRIVHRKQMREEVSRVLEFFWRSTRGFAPDGKPSPHGSAALPAAADGRTKLQDG